MSDVTAVPLRAVEKGTTRRLWLGLGALALAGAGFAWMGTSRTIATHGTAEQFLSWHKGRTGVKTTASGLQYQVIKAGAGASPTDADVVLVNYKGTLVNGAVFDQAEKAPFPVTGVVPGFTEALKLMNRGSEYRFWIPPALGYGEQSPDPKLPPHSVLVFDVKLLEFKSQAEVQAMQQMMRQQQQGGAAPQ